MRPMGCYVGMTRDLDARLEQHRRDGRNFRSYDVLRSGLGYDQAQALEEAEAAKHHCDHHEGGSRGGIRDGLGNWTVYRLNDVG